MNGALCSLLLLVMGTVAGWGITIDPAISYNNISRNQTYTGALGMAFEVNRSIDINGLGVFDSGSNGLSRGIYVEIRQITSLGGRSSCSGSGGCSFTTAGTTLASSPIASASLATSTSYPLIGGTRWQQLAPITLSTGYWMIIARGNGPGEPNYDAQGGSASHVSALNTFGAQLPGVSGPISGTPTAQDHCQTSGILGTGVDRSSGMALERSA